MIMAMLFAMLLSLGGIDVKPAPEDGWYLISGEGLAHIMAYVEELETKVNELEKHVAKQDEFVAIVVKDNEELRARIVEIEKDCYSLGNVIVSGAVGVGVGAIVVLIIINR